MSIVSEIQKDMAVVNEKITAERKKGADKRDKRKVQKLQREYAALKVELSNALVGKTTRKLNAKKPSKIQDPPEEPEKEEEEEESEEEDEDEDEEE